MFQAGQIIDTRYQLEKPLGKNLPGKQTWLAADKLNNNSKVVIKLLAFISNVNWNELKMFERESEILQTLNHKYIPNYRSYLEIKTDNNVTWFALIQDYIPGNSLADLLKNGQRFTEDRLKNIAFQVLDIITYLHGLNPPVLHRDIKPSNLILGEDNKIYLIDFGAVQNAARLTGMTFTIAGTTGYAPMEQFYGKAFPASDLYALGMTIINLLTGIDPIDIKRKNQRVQFQQLAGKVSPNFINWLHNLTDLDLEKRPQNCQQAINRLKNSSYTLAVNSTIKETDINKAEIIISADSFKIYLPVIHPDLSGCGAAILGTVTLFIVLIAIIQFNFVLLLFIFSNIIAFAFYSSQSKISTMDKVQVTFTKNSLSIINPGTKPNISFKINPQDIKISVLEINHGKDNSYYLTIKGIDLDWQSEPWYKQDLELIAQEVRHWLKNCQ